MWSDRFFTVTEVAWIGAWALPFHYGWVIAAVGCLGMVASVPERTIGVNVFNEKLIVVLGLSRAQVSAA